MVIKNNLPSFGVMLLAFFSFLAFLPFTAMADVVRMKNGDHLTGTIDRMEKEVLLFHADYAEEKISIS